MTARRSPAGASVRVPGGARVGARRRGALALALIGTTGCYTYRPLPPGVAPEPESTVRVYAPLSDLPVSLRRGDSPFIEGRVADWSSDSARIAVPDPNFASTRATELTWRDTLVLPVRSITHVERRELHRGRTAAFGLALGVGVPLVVRALFNWARNQLDPIDDPVDPGPPPP